MYGVQITRFTNISFLVTESFGQFDYGPVLNVRHYNSTEPPTYDLKSINVPITLIYGENDLLADEEVSGFFFLFQNVFRKLLSHVFPWTRRRTWWDWRRNCPCWWTRFRWRARTATTWISCGAWRSKSSWTIRSRAYCARRTTWAGGTPDRTRRSSGTRSVTPTAKARTIRWRGRPRARSDSWTSCWAWTTSWRIWTR